jgi:hypothetical protein
MTTVLSLVVEFQFARVACSMPPHSSDQSFKLMKHKNFKLGALKTLYEGFASLFNLPPSGSAITWAGCFSGDFDRATDTRPAKPGYSGNADFRRFRMFSPTECAPALFSDGGASGRFAAAAVGAANSVTADRRFEPGLLFRAGMKPTIPSELCLVVDERIIVSNRIRVLCERTFPYARLVKFR